MKKYSTACIVLTAVILALFLRSFNLGSLISPYWEEVALGYDAYSIVRTGADHHGNSWPLVAFESFGDWKPSGYFYFAAVAIKMFGLSVFSVRLPSMLAGVAIVVGMYYVSKLLIQRFAPALPVKQRLFVQVASVVLAALSSWLVMFSRAAWEVNLATAFLLWGVIIFLRFIPKRNVFYLLPSIILFALSVYTYHATRVIAPLVFLGLLVSTFFEQFKSNRNKMTKQTLSNWLPKTELVLGLLFIAFLVPLIASMRSAAVSQRFAETSIFSSLSIIEESNQAIALFQTPGARYFFHRYVLFTREILKNAVSHFSLDFLFVHGDINKRHSTGFVGILYYLDAIFLVAGVYALARRYRTLGAVILGGVGIGLIPASISLATPHALRILPIAPLVIFILAFGLSELYFFAKKKVSKQVVIIIFMIGTFIYIGQVVAFWRYYTVVYPQESALEWQYGYADTMLEVERYIQEGKRVAVSRTYGRPAMYYFFINAVDPLWVQDRQGKELMDQSEFLSFNNITFFDSAEHIENANVVFVSSQNKEVLEQLVNSDAVLVYEKTSPSGIVLWQGYEKK